LRILHVLDHALPLQSGYVSRSMGILRQQRRMGWDTIQLVAPRQQAGSGSYDIDIWRFHRTLVPAGVFARLPLLNYWAEMRATEARILEVARAERPDLIHAHSPALNGLPAVRAGRALGLPVVYEVRAFWEDAAADLGRLREGDLRYRLTRALETHVLRRADAVTTLCQGTRDDIVARGIPAEKVTIIPNAVDVAAFSPVRRIDAALQQRLGLGGMLVLGFIGSFYRYEGLELLVAALPELRASHPDLRLLLVGGGLEEAALRAQVARLGLEDAVIMPGRVPHAEVSAYYDLVDLFVYPRRRMRLTDLVTPLKPIEAMANGRLVAASDVGGHREIVEDGVNGYLFPADDGAALVARLREILGRREAWAAVEAAGRRYVEDQRSWEASAARYVPVYERLVGSRRPAGQAPAR
jgi:PEP-CTERM/exosortase A-associated glycosyltransferase